ncbi:hypothetical protein LJ737_06740 [Hymenobacter sp. 15J16-1T3B]|uniref:hypothetical protein n=1 Tax=Hymenobacter sp. 15J16-1T3B TaxID=2886941 RepID=UPI001D104BFF|nr:hypothetical protein [Hymenobacter sp. 15J16-1T3B]MCC3156926.1 hypothetical protein [Hymenobacter sp. 15J16-1T3B]
MNRLSLLLASLLLALLAVPGFAQKTKRTTLKAGTLVVLETSNPLSSKDAQVGQSVTLRVKYDVMINGRAVIKAGAPGSAQVVAAEQRKGLGKEGSLSIRPTVVQAVDGQMVPLTGNGVGQNGDDTKGGTIALAVVVSPLFLLKKGKDATIPAGYEMQANVASETVIQ